MQKTFDAEGNLLDQAFEKRAKEFVDELVWMRRVLKVGQGERAVKVSCCVKNKYDPRNNPNRVSCSFVDRFFGED